MDFYSYLLQQQVLHIQYQLSNFSNCRSTTYNNNNNVDVSLVSQSTYNDGNLFHIVEVQNTGTVSAEYVEIVASFYDGNGQFVGTSFTYTNPTTVSPGMKAPFDIQYRNYKKHYR